MDERKRDLALRVGGVGLCTLMFSDLKVKEDPSSSEENPLPKILVQGAGFNLTLDFITRLLSKHDDFMLTELLVLMPTLKCINEFMDRLKPFKVSQDELEYLVKLGHII